MAIAAIDKLVMQLSKLPGVGQKTAQRYAYFVLGMDKEQTREMAQALLDAAQNVHPCPICGMYTDQQTCEICTDKRRTDELICVVSDPKDVIAMEKTREFMGKYHVLFGSLSPMDGIGPNEIRINSLLDRCNNGGIKEVILATDSDAKGDVTASYIAKLLKPLGITATRIARGIPIGGNLEYIDEVTLLKALEGRREM
ncbi:MAG: recombination mediator RecR [Eubacteriales bacterium]|nr:recombination mediator RecR [Eubacteriales bacterium]